MNFDAILFDLDGTLLDTLDDIADAMNRALAEHGFPTHPAEAYRYFVGDGVEMLLRRALPAERQSAEVIETCRREYQRQYGLSWNVKTRLYEGIAEMLDAAVGLGLKLAVFSNKPHQFTCQCVQHYLARWSFAAVLGQTAELPRKPDPAGALEIARRLGLRPERFLYLGDTATDMKTARAAGMTSVGALWGFRTREELETSGASVIVRSPREIVALFQQ